MAADFPPRILIVIGSLEMGGAQQVATALANAWHRRGCPVSVLTYAETRSDAFALDAGIPRIVLPFFPARPGLLRLEALVRLGPWLLRLRRSIRRTGADTVISFIHTTNILTVVACLGLRGVRLVISERNDPLRQDIGPRWALLRRLLYRFADVVTANSHGALEAMGAYVPREKLAFVPNPVRSAPSTHAAPLAKPTMLAVGRLVHQKGVDVLLEAFARAAPALPDWRLALLGDGPLREALEARARTLEIAGRVDWLGRVEDPFPYYRGARMLVMASRFEGIPNALLEAMSCGLPAIVTDGSPGPLELVEHEITGLVVPVENPVALADAIRQLAGDAALRTRLGEAGRERLAGYAGELAIA
jgi:glycosyltransferase involved in cell wall biosynthesis